MSSSVQECVGGYSRRETTATLDASDALQLSNHFARERPGSPGPFMRQASEVTQGTLPKRGHVSEAKAYPCILKQSIESQWLAGAGLLGRLLFGADGSSIRTGDCDAWHS